MGDYEAIRRDLLRANRWLRIFEDSLDDEIKNGLEPVAVSVPRYDCFASDELLKDVSQSLDRCLVYRREYNELEAVAVKAALDYDLFTKSVKTNSSLEEAAWIEDQRAAENTAQGLAEQAFAGGADPIAKGFGAIAHGSAASTAIGITGEKSRKKYVKSKWDLLTDYQTTLESRHNMPGHPLNFAERASKAKAFLIDDLKEAYEKCRCIDKGVRIIYGLAGLRSLPDIDVPGFLDELVFWVRGAMREIEFAQLDQIEFEHVVSGRQPSVGRAGNYQTITEQDWTSAIVSASASGKFEFDVRKSFVDVGVFTNLRVRGIGMSMSHSSPTDANGRLWRTSAMGFPPELSNEPFNRANFAQRAPVILENIGLSEPQQRVRLVYPDSIGNIDPRGVWTVQLSTNTGYPDYIARPRDGNIQDLKLHFHLIGKPSKTIGDWKNFWW